MTHNARTEGWLFAFQSFAFAFAVAFPAALDGFAAAQAFAKGDR